MYTTAQIEINKNSELKRLFFNLGSIKKQFFRLKERSERNYKETVDIAIQIKSILSLVSPGK